MKTRFPLSFVLAIVILLMLSLSDCTTQPEKPMELKKSIREMERRK